MNAITYTFAQQNLAETINRVCSNHEPLIITTNNKQSVVMISLDDYKSMKETAYLLSNPKNAEHLLESVLQLKTGLVQERELPDC